MKIIKSANAWVADVVSVIREAFGGDLVWKFRWSKENPHQQLLIVSEVVKRGGLLGWARPRREHCFLILKPDGTGPLFGTATDLDSFPDYMLCVDRNRANSATKVAAYLEQETGRKVTIELHDDSQ